MSLGKAKRTSQDITATTGAAASGAAALGELWTRFLGQDSSDSWDPITGARKLGQDSQIRQSGKYIQDRKQRTRLPEQTGQGDGTTMAGQLA